MNCILEDKPQSLIAHVGINNLTNDVNFLNKTVNKTKKKPANTVISFSIIIIRKDRRNLEKSHADTNSRLKNFCKQKNIGLIDDENLKENQLGIKKLHLNRKGNILFAKNLLKFIEDNWNFRSETDIFKEENGASDDSTVLQSDVKKSLKNIRTSNNNKLIFGHLNVNSLRNKFDILSEQTKCSIDIFMVSETKLDDSFPEGQLLIKGFHSPFKFDRNKNGGRIMLYVREDIPANLLNHDFPSAESVFI